METIHERTTPERLAFPVIPEQTGVGGKPAKVPITHCRLVPKKVLKKMINSHGLQSSVDFHEALNVKVNVMVLEAMKRMMEDGWRIRLGIEDL